MRFRDLDMIEINRTEFGLRLMSQGGDESQRKECDMSKLLLAFVSAGVAALLSISLPADARSSDRSRVEGVANAVEHTDISARRHWRHRHWGPRRVWWGPRYRYWGPRHYWGPRYRVWGPRYYGGPRYRAWGPRYYWRPRPVFWAPRIYVAPRPIWWGPRYDWGGPRFYW
jgi:hypothetical protein